MKKILILGLAILMVLLFVLYVCLKVDYEKKIRTLQAGECYGYYMLESALSGFYFRNGEFPEAIVSNNTDSLYGHDKLVGIPFQLVDILAREDSGMLMYYPIYSRINGKRESFVLLSTGVDGKLDNMILDTLYMDNWWTQLKVYNIEEVMGNAFYKQAWNIVCVRTPERIEYLGNDLNSINMGLFDPRFSIFRYLWGKKDYVVRYGLPYYIQRGDV